MRVAVVGVLVGAFLFGSMLRESGGDAFVITAVGGGEIAQFVENEIGRSIVSRENPGHDGRFFMLQSRDPFMSDPFTVEQLDPTRYRAQRVFYPLVAGLGGLLPLRFIPWTMALVHILSFGLGSYALGELAARRDLTRWWGLGFALNPGMWGSLQIGGASTIAVALGLYAVLLVDRERFIGAGIVFAASLLTRETMVLMLIGVVVQQLLVHRRFRFDMVSLAVVPSMAWAVFLRIQIPVAAKDANGAIGLPLAGFSEAIEVWSRSTQSIAFGGVTVALALLTGFYGLIRRDLIVWACAPFSALFFVLTPSVLRLNFDYSRAIAPVYISSALIAAIALKYPREAAEAAEEPSLGLR